MSICAFCSSVVARTDRDVALVGKAAALVDTHSPLALGAEGSYQGSHFALVGRTQLAHPAGGVWDEWYLAFDDGRWGWLAEAQGKFYLTFQSRSARELPELSDLRPGFDVELGIGGRWVVQEVSHARLNTAEGELPYDFRPGDTYEYVDLSGSKGAFATLDYGERPPVLFLGREISLSDLKVQARAGVATGPEIKTAALSCPHCAGPLALRAPDQTLRVTCPNCDSLLDADRGVLKYLTTLPHDRSRIYLEPGTEGALRGSSYTAIGYMRRSCMVEGIRYSWDEYLLYNPQVGFRWLMESDGHWNFIEPVPAADVMSAGRLATYDGKTFRKFQEVQATVDAVRGEFYWRVEVGERVVASDYVNPPLLLSEEVSGTESLEENRYRKAPVSMEVNWSKGTYLPAKEIWEGFKLAGDPPVPSGIAPNQPSPHDKTVKELTGWALAFFIALVGIFVVSAIGAKKETVFVQEYKLPFTADAKGEQVIFSDPFEIKDGRHSIEVRVNSNVSNSWLYLNGALVSEETGAVAQFDVENSFYFGTDGGESWSEGSPSAEIYLSALPPGMYVLRLESQYDPARPAPQFKIQIATGEIRSLYAFLALMIIVMGPLGALLARSAFENRRWQESMYSGGSE